MLDLKINKFMPWISISISLISRLIHIVLLPYPYPMRYSNYIIYSNQIIFLQKNLSSHKNIITYVASSITEVTNGIFELLILMEYCRGKDDTLLKT